jgi:hypothetical protein
MRDSVARMHTRLLSILVIVAAVTAPVIAGNRERGIATASAGGGKYTVVSATGDLAEMLFGYGAVVTRNGRARGHLLHIGTFQGETIEFHGEVTCLAVDSENHRAWIGGVITKNRSTHPTYRDSVWAQPGEDIWFRVLDADAAGTGEQDRTTFVGFEGAIPSSEAYCRDRIWPDGNARTWPVQGNIVVKR